MKNLLLSLDSTLRRVVPELAAQLRPPVSEDELAHAGAVIGTAWPEDLKALYRWHNGEDYSRKHVGLFGAFALMEIGALIDMWKVQCSDFEDFAAHDPYDIDDPNRWGAVRPWTQRPPSWIQIASVPQIGIYLMVDLEPGPTGAIGQLVAYDQLMPECCTLLSSSLTAYFTDLERGLSNGSLRPVLNTENNRWNWESTDGKPFRPRGYGGCVWDTRRQPIV